MSFPWWRILLNDYQQYTLQSSLNFLSYLKNKCKVQKRFLYKTTVHRSLNCNKIPHRIVFEFLYIKNMRPVWLVLIFISYVKSREDEVGARVTSKDETFIMTYKENIILPCLAVGKPEIIRTWKIKGVTFATSDHIRMQPDGSLFLRDITRTDAGEYFCHVINRYGEGFVTYQLVVMSLPRSPRVTVTDTTTSSLTIKLGPNPDDTEPIDGYTIHYKYKFGDWETIQVENQTQKFTLENLYCGTIYQIQVTAFNRIGTSDPSDNINTRTQGDKPGHPSADKFIEALSNGAVLHLYAWSDGGCPILYFITEFKKKTSTDWLLVSNNIKPRGKFVISELEPAVRYDLRVTAHNYAGFNVAEYEFATLPLTEE